MGRTVRFLLLLIISWCVMTTTHEAGHVAGGWLSGGTLQEASLAPWGLPHSRFEPDPHPLVTLWSGPVLGVVVPVMIATIVRRPATWFVGHFCVLANGCYLALAWVTGDNHLDTARLFAAGCPAWMVVFYCVVTIAIGYVWFREACVRVLTPPGSKDGPVTHSRSARITPPTPAPPSPAPRPSGAGRGPGSGT